MMGRTTESAEFLDLPVAQIVRNPDQPRRYYDRGELRALADSIRTAGVIQPIVVQPIDDGWQIIAGERRWRACQLASLPTVTCRIMHDLTEREVARLALLENLDRAELRPTEIGSAYAQLARSGMSHGEVAQWVGKHRTEITRYIGLARLPKPVQDTIDSGELSVGHAKVLLGLERGEQIRLAHVARGKGWSVRRLEAAVKEGRASANKAPAADSVDRLAQALGERLGAACALQQAGGEQWRLTIQSHAPDALVGMLQQLASELDERGAGEGPVTVSVEGGLPVFDFLGR